VSTDSAKGRKIQACDPKRHTWPERVPVGTI
jgi:hypothetical protein